MKLSAQVKPISYLKAHAPEIICTLGRCAVRIAATAA